jgi:hypothetical protein
MVGGVVSSHVPDEEMQDLRMRIAGLEKSQLENLKQILEVRGSIMSTQKEVEFLRLDINKAVNSVTNLTDTISKWKGVIMFLIVLGPLLGPILAIIVRVLFFGAPPSALPGHP